MIIEGEGLRKPVRSTTHNISQPSVDISVRSDVTGRGGQHSFSRGSDPPWNQHRCHRFALVPGPATRSWFGHPPTGDVSFRTSSGTSVRWELGLVPGGSSHTEPEELQRFGDRGRDVKIPSVCWVFFLHSQPAHNFHI